MSYFASSSSYKYQQIFPIQLTFLQFASMLFLAEDFCLWAWEKIQDKLG